MVNSQLLTSIIAIVSGVALASPALADGLVDERAPKSELSGFYGGLSMRDRGSESDGLQFGHLSSAWGKFTFPATEDSGARTLAYGGFRWANDIAVEAAVASADRFALRPDATSARPGMGLAFASGGEAAARTWNADVYTSWGFAKRFALYGRLGYVQNEPVSLYPVGVLGSGQRNRDGVNYGLGLRYDVNPVLGLRLEYARYGRLAGEPMSGVLPESDQVQFGLQFRF